MYGLPQAGRLANMAPHGYHPVPPPVHGLWTHDIHPVTFTLVVDDFRIKYVGKENACHLLDALKQDYEVTEDWTGGFYFGIKLDWDYKNKTVDLSMPGYIDNALHKFQHIKSARPHRAHYPAQAPQFG
jgi:hypothetical protein